MPARSKDLASIQRFIPSIQIGDFDKPSWMPFRSGTFNAYETWDAIRSKLPVVAWWKIVWFSCAIPKHAFFILG
jgi:hypothetical protein